jgi:hypothetical protein
MQTKLCSECGHPAEVSLCQILSTVGRKAREQRCSTSMPFCAACLQSRIKLLCRLGLHGLHQPLEDAFTALANACGMTPTRQCHPVSVPANKGDR